MGRDHVAEPRRDGRPARRHRHLGRGLWVRSRGVPRRELPQARPHLSAAAQAHRRLPRQGREALRGRGARPVPRGAHPAAGHPGRRRQGPAAALRRVRPRSRRPLPVGGRRAGRREPSCCRRVEPAPDELPDRPPTLCPGCSHRGVFVALRKMRAFVAGDIGCYSLGALAPFEAMHCSTCMGAGISMAHGMAKVLDETADRKQPARRGDRRQHVLPLRHHLAAGRGLQPERRAHASSSTTAPRP